MANCLCTVYSTLASYKTAVEALDDTKYLGTFTYTEPGTKLQKIILVYKA